MTALLNCKEKIETLQQMLAEENELLRSAAFDNLQDIIQLKLDATAELDAAMREIDDQEKQQLAVALQKLNALSQENGILLKSIANGAEAARNRLQNVRQQEAQIGAYGKNGQSLYLSDGVSLARKTV